MDRKEELLSVFENIDKDKKIIIINLIDDVIYIEQQLVQLRKLPFIKYKIDNPSQQKSTPAAKQYKELLQQYNNCIKILCSLLSKTETNEDSPLRKYMRRFE